MKKLTFWKSLFLLFALIVGSTSVWAAETTISVGSSNLTWTADGDNYKASSGDFNIRYEKGSYTNSISGGIQSNELRLYSGTNFVISSSNTITKIVYNVADGSGKNYSVANLSTEDGNLVDGTWTGSANSISASLSAQNRIKSVTITYSTGGGTEPSVSLSTTSLNFGNVYIGETKNMTFTVTPANLTGDLTIASNNAKYTVSPTSIAKATTTETTITVTAAPTAENDNMDGTITISGGGLATNKTVILTTTAIDPLNSKDYVIVTDANTLRTGDQLLIACSTQSKALGAIESGGKYYTAENVTISEGVISNPTDVAVLTLGGEAGAWTLKSSLSNQYLSLTGASNELRAAETVSGNNTENWIITIDGDGKAIIQNKANPQKDNKDHYIQWNNGSPRFACYNSKQTAVQLYRLSKSVTITSAEYATYSGSKALNFDGVGITVYTAQDKETSVGLTEITSGQVPANTPVVLYKEGLTTTTTFNVPVIAEADAIEGTNDLRVKDDGVDGENMYVLANGSKGVGFYPWAGSKLNEGKVYLQGKSSYGNARDFLAFGGTATGITNVDVNANIDYEAPMYNLAGQRVNKSYKGVVIVNGKKMLNK